MIPKILKNFNAYVDGRGFAGSVEEVVLPKFSLKTEEFRCGGMDCPVSIDMGMEALTCEMTFSEYDVELFRLFGIVGGNPTALTLRGALQSGTDTQSVVIQMRGLIKELDCGSWKAADKTQLKCSVALSYYKLQMDHHECIEIDVENMVRKINGVDQCANIRQALGN